MPSTTVQPFLMFEGKAEEAINFYVSLFPGAHIHAMEKYLAGQPGPAGTVKLARFTIAGQTVLATDSPIHHAFTFTPALSLFVECTSDNEINRFYETLLAGGAALMPLGSYGFSTKFAWINDRFGVSWQLNLP